MASYSPIIVARFWSKVDVRPSQDECWEWQASKNQHGYGKFKESGSVRNASRIAWEIANGTRLGDLVARHTCDNPGCCNPNHLVPGTPGDNVSDAVKRGRARAGSMPGEMNPRAKITAKDVAAIRARCANGEEDGRVAADFPIGQEMVRRIRLGLSWRGVGGP